MFKRIYEIHNITSCNFSFDEKECKIYKPEVKYMHSGLPYYEIIATPFSAFKLRIRFWFLRKKNYGKLRIKKRKL